MTRVEKLIGVLYFDKFEGGEKFGILRMSFDLYHNKEKAAEWYNNLLAELEEITDSTTKKVCQLNLKELYESIIG
jgi:hypothetical protein